jgi:hypothetical protein
LEACMKVGHIAGQFILLEDADHAAIADEFATVKRRPRLVMPGPITPQTVPPSGLGAALHSVLGPIGRRIKWPCMKGDGTTDLKPGSPCAKRVQKLNAAGAAVAAAGKTILQSAKTAIIGR